MTVKELKWLPLGIYVSVGETDSEQGSKGIPQESRWSETAALRMWHLNKGLNLEVEAAQVSRNEDPGGETSR